MKKTVLCKYSCVDIASGFIETIQSLCLELTIQTILGLFMTSKITTLVLRLGCDKYLMMFTDHKHWKIFSLFPQITSTVAFFTKILNLPQWAAL